MQDASVFSSLAWSLATIFWLIGFTHLLGPRFLRNAFDKWNYGTKVRLLTGSLEIAAALLLAHPETRSWGIALAAVIMFGAVITLLSHEQYLIAVPSVALMLALIPAMLAVPHPDNGIHFATIKTVAGQQLADNAQAL